MSIQNNFPAIKPTLLLDFANTEVLDPRITFTRASTATYFDQFGIMQTAASGVPRFEHNPVTLESLGLLIEEQRTNLLTWSEQFDNAVWTKGNSTITADTIVSPDGTVDADKLVENTATSTHVLTLTASTSFTSGLTYTFSIYVKSGERFRGLITLATGATAFGGVVSANFNLQAGTITAANGSPTVSITSVGNGWFRLTITKTAVATANEQGLGVRLADDAGTNSYTGNGFSGFFVWGAQLEAGAFATSYIPTVASQVTRAADNASMTGTNFSSWYSQGQGTLYTEFNPMVLAASSGVLVNDNTTSNRIRLATTSVSDQGTVTTSGVAQAVLDGGTPTANTSMKLAMTYQVNNFALSLNGATATIDTSGTVPVVSQLQIGAETTTVGSLTIKKFAFYPIVSTATQLQALTL